MDRQESLGDEERAYLQLIEAAEGVTDDRRTAEGVVPGWSTHDVLWHTAYWVGRAADVMQRAAGGPPYPEEPEDGAYYDSENDRAFLVGREMRWEEIVDHLTTSRTRARDTVQRCEARDLEWLCERLSEESEHYREHAAQIRAFVGLRPG